jgi:hypothetical protein
MNVQETVATAKCVLDIPVTGLTIPEGKTDAAERLIRAVTVFLSLEPASLRDELFAEAQNRMMIAYAVGKKPWEMGS